jgi:hypothetical protein
MHIAISPTKQRASIKASNAAIEKMNTMKVVTRAGVDTRVGGNIEVVPRHDTGKALLCIAESMFLVGVRASPMKVVGQCGTRQQGQGLKEAMRTSGEVK